MSPPAAPRSALLGDILGAVNAAASSFATAVALSTLVFAPLGREWLPSALVACVLAASLGGLIAAIFSSTAVSVSAPRAAISIVIAALVATVHRELPELPAQAIIALAGITVLTAGLLQVVGAGLRLGQLVRFVPFPVIAGFTHGIALTLALVYLPLLLGVAEVPRLAMPRWGSFAPAAALVGAATLAALFAFARWTPRLPGVFLGLASGVALAKALELLVPGIDLGGLLSTRMPENFVLPTAEWSVVPQALRDPSAPRYLLSFAVAIAAIASIDALVGAMAVETRYGLRSRPDRDLFAQGMANVFCGAAGAVGISYGAAQVTAARSAGATGRLASILCALLIPGIAIASALAVDSVPVSVLGAIMVYLARRLADPWGFALWRTALGPEGRRDRTVRLTLMVYLVVALSIVLLDIVAALAVGMAVSAILFVRTMNQHLVRGMQSGASVRSRRLYPHAIHERLEQLMGSVAMVELQGPLFFGTADRIVAEVGKLPKGVRYVVLDLRRVQALDATASLVIGRLRARMKAEGREIVLSGRPPGLAAGDASLPPIFADRDRAAEWVEDQLLAEEGIDVTSGELPAESFASFIGASAAERPVLARYTQVLDLAARDAVFRFGDASNQLYFLLSGRVTIQYEAATGSIRVVTLLPGNVFGHIAFIDGQPRSADALCDVPSRVLVLDRDALTRMLAEEPGLAALLHAMAARDIAGRLRATDRIVREMI